MERARGARQLGNMKRSPNPRAALAAPTLLLLATPSMAYATPAVDDSSVVVALYNVPGNDQQVLGYLPMVQLGLFGGVEDGDVVRLTASQGSRALGEQVCPLTLGPLGTAVTTDCAFATAPFTVHGAIDIDVAHVSASAAFSGDARGTTLRRVTVQVGRFVDWIGEWDGVTQSTVYYQAVADDLLGSSTVVLRNTGLPWSEVNFHFWAYQLGYGSIGGDPSFRCAIDGQLLPELAQSNQTVSHLAGISVDYRDASAGPPTGTTTRSYVHYVVSPNLASGPRESWNPAWTRVEDHPGSWVCQLRSNLRLVREFRFTVDATGIVSQAPTGGSGFSLPPWSRFVETRFPASNFLDVSFQPDAIRRTAFFGHAWPASPAVTAMLGALPAAFGHSDAPPAAAPRAGGRAARR